VHLRQRCPVSARRAHQARPCAHQGGAPPPDAPRRVETDPPPRAPARAANAPFDGAFPRVTASQGWVEGDPAAAAPKPFADATL